MVRVEVRVVDSVSEGGGKGGGESGVRVATKAVGVRVMVVELERARVVWWSGW